MSDPTSKPSSETDRSKAASAGAGDADGVRRSTPSDPRSTASSGKTAQPGATRPSSQAGTSGSKAAAGSGTAGSNPTSLAPTGEASKDGASPEVAASAEGKKGSAVTMPPVAELKGRKIGRILTKMGKVTRDQVNEALDMQKQRRSPLGQLLIELGYVTEDDVNAGLAAQAGMASMELDSLDIPKEVIDTIGAETAQSYQVLPLQYDKASNTLTIALKSASNFRAVDDLHLLLGFNVKPVVATTSKSVETLLAKYYGGVEESMSDLIGELASDTNLEQIGGADESIDLATLIEAADDNKVKRLLNLVLMQAIKDKAADIHFEPFEDELKMRYRIDGVLYEMVPPPRHLAMPIISRVKVMANLDIAERRMPQDGRINLTVNGNPVDLRVAVLPTLWGESVVLRILDRTNTELDLEKIGLRPDDLETVNQLIRKPNGVVIVTGPTGSGKTTTLYSALAALNTLETKILTAEDPVEYDIDGLVQVQINPAVDMTFARALRSFLRQDPDIVLIGETRDLETAKIGVEAALTGHLVFTTLHTNDAPSSIARLLDLGLESFLITATIEGVIAQRLVRRICDKCREAYSPSEQELMELALLPEDVKDRQFYRGTGCEFCKSTGYKGRTALYEIMVLDDEIREMIMQNAATQILREESRKRGTRSLRQSGMLTIYDGISTIDEVVRETLSEEE